MGFNVNNTTGEVTVDHSHDTYAVTTVKGNPTNMVVRELKITSLFRRTRSKRQKGDLGDNSPMLYAFKGMHGLKVNYRSMASLIPNFYELIDNVIANDNLIWDCIIPIPSGHDIPKIIAKRISRKRKSMGRIEPHALKKVTVRDVQAQIKALRIKSSEKTKLNSLVKKFLLKNSLDDDFQMKSIKDPSLRKYINPLLFHRLISNSPPKNILLIDDMVTSGSTLTHAVDSLKARYPLSTINALTLIGTSK